jgi:GTPase SAR1 family protein
MSFEGDFELVNLTSLRLKPFRVLLLGDFCVGKTSFLRQFIEGKFSTSTFHTAGVDVGTRHVRVLDASITINFEFLTSLTSQSLTEIHFASFHRR